MKKYLNISFAVLALFLGKQEANAQDGAALFKAKCNTCHMVDKNSTGPILKGVKQKWADAGEAEMLYEWVKNPQTLIASGKSKTANESKNFSAADMTPQTVSNEEVDAILDYVDNYAPPAAATSAAPADAAGSTSTAVEVETVPNYKSNLTLFYFLLACSLILLIGIIVMSTSITTLVRSNYFRKRIEENGKKDSTPLVTILALIGVFGTMSISNKSYALTFMQPGEAEKDTPWLMVETIDIYMMVLINLVLLGVLLYLRKMFKDFLGMVRPEVVSETRSSRKAKKLNTILTDSVAIEEEHTILMHHEYDGIRELDNNLPPWWVWGFYATIIFSVIYLFNYHIFQTSDLQIKEYEKEVAQAKKDVDAYLSKMAMNVDETNATLLTDAGDISQGKALYDANCVACHNPKGEGNIGPNLTDKFWIYGPDVKDVFKTIKSGTPKGMPEHASKMNPIQLQQVSSYVLSLPETKGKEPQGEAY